MQSQYRRNRADFLYESTRESRINEGGQNLNSLRKIVANLRELARIQYLGTNSEIQVYIGDLMMTPELFEEVPQAILSIILFDFLIPSVDSNIQAEIFKHWDENLIKKFNYFDVEETISGANSFTKLVKRLARLYSSNFHNETYVPPFYILVLLKEYFDSFMEFHCANKTKLSDFCLNMQSIANVLNEFILIYTEEIKKRDNSLGES